MIKLAAGLILLFSLFLLPNFASHELYTTALSAKATPTPEALPEVESVTLDKDVDILWCPFSFLPEDKQECPKSGENIKISTRAENARSADVNYYYVVSGGQIIGDGPDVVWNFENTRPGKYEITVGIGKDNVMFGKTITKTIELKECPTCDRFCACPTITIIGPKNPVRPGASIIFEVRVEGGGYDFLTYKWTVSKGVITGQGTSRIIVKTMPDMAGYLTATVEIGRVCPECHLTESKTILFTGNRSKN